jgi:regulator of sigma E protease
VREPDIGCGGAAGPLLYSWNVPSSAAIILGILAVGFLIVVHEGGHYFVARWCGMRIERFSVGFGPAILKTASKKTGTIFQLAPIPFGGFVEIRGMNIAEDIDPDDIHAYPNRPAWQRFVTIFAGPATNYLAAMALAMVLFTCHGVDNRVAVEKVLPGYDAAAKLLPGDRIRAVDHRAHFVGEGLPSLGDRVQATRGAPITVTIERAGVERDISIIPQLKYGENRPIWDALDHLKERAPAFEPILPIAAGGYPRPVWLIGVVQQPDASSVGIVEAAGHALYYPILQTKRIGKMLYGIVFGSEKADPGGPIRMVEELGHQFSRGLVSGIILVMALSVYLGLFNLLPLPALDGGRLVFLAYELITRRRANPKVEATVHMAGILALAVIMILVLIVDIRRII